MMDDELRTEFAKIHQSLKDAAVVRVMCFIFIGIWIVILLFAINARASTLPISLPLSDYGPPATDLVYNTDGSLTTVLYDNSYFIPLVDSASINGPCFDCSIPPRPKVCIDDCDVTPPQVPTVTPEPELMWLLMLGLAIVAVVDWRLRKRRDRE